MPVYNEEKTVGKILEKVVKAKIPIKKEIIIVDDGSVDNSEKIIKKAIVKHKSTNIKYFHKKNGGKGSAIRQGLKKAKGDIFIIQDADLEYDPHDYHILLIPILKEHTKVVYGSRYLSTKGHLVEHNHLTYKLHKLGNSFLSLLTSIFYFKHITDMETCYTVFTREVYESMRLKSNSFDIEAEITANILKNRFNVIDIPINYFSRDFSEGKKITWRDGVRATYCLLKYRFFD